MGGAAARTGANFYNVVGARNASAGGAPGFASGAHQSSNNSLLGSDSVSKPVMASKVTAPIRSNNFTNVVADDADDDWDNEDSAMTIPSNNVNQRESNGMSYFNRAPLNMTNASA